MTMNFAGRSLPESMAGVPSASSEATGLVSLDPRPSPAHSLGLSFGVGSPSAPGHSLSKTQSLSPWYIFWDVSHLEMRVTSKSLESSSPPPGPPPFFPLLLMLISKLAVAVVLAAKNISMISFLFWVYSFIRAFISLYLC